MAALRLLCFALTQFVVHAASSTPECKTFRSPREQRDGTVIDAEDAPLCLQFSGVGYLQDPWALFETREVHLTGVNASLLISRECSNPFLPPERNFLQCLWNLEAWHAGKCDIPVDLTTWVLSPIESLCMACHGPRCKLIFVVSRPLFPWTVVCLATVVFFLAPSQAFLCVVVRLVCLTATSFCAFPLPFYGGPFEDPRGLVCSALILAAWAFRCWWCSDKKLSMPDDGQADEPDGPPPENVQAARDSQAVNEPQACHPADSEIGTQDSSHDTALNRTKKAETVASAQASDAEVDRDASASKMNGRAGDSYVDTARDTPAAVDDEPEQANDTAGDTRKPKEKAKAGGRAAPAEVTAPVAKEKEADGVVEPVQMGRLEGEGKGNCKAVAKRKAEIQVGAVASAQGSLMAVDDQQLEVNETVAVTEDTCTGGDSDIRKRKGKKKSGGRPRATPLAAKATVPVAKEKEAAGVVEPVQMGFAAMGPLEGLGQGKGQAAAKRKKDHDDKTDASAAAAEAEGPKGKKGKATVAAAPVSVEGKEDATGKRKTRSRAEPKAAEQDGEKPTDKRTRRQ